MDRVPQRLVGILLITVTPSGSYADSGSCALRDWTPIQPSRLFTLNHDALNVWVFFALGLATTALPGRSFFIGVGLACLTPPVIELVQYLLPALGRSCQSGDLVSNWTGAVVALLIAAGVRTLRRRL
ncbi:hypothetical protein FNH13_14840 [Ornithinimicrobium ciconiae]|uniref:VanZ-like domain-containing protein n=1 Tax=Ornithinimicrobium ciconiae TaxID=2594265 RepID=A0A516GD50_9MICO|nr:hypothetical protein FNH13_14840 [Ornithinimicrobium ciconiae]